MFEECFSMIEFTSMGDPANSVVSDATEELDFDELQSLLVSALDEALSKLDEEFSALRYSTVADTQ